LALTIGPFFGARGKLVMVTCQPHHYRLRVGSFASAANARISVARPRQ
jgi:hypothetical protein